MVLPLILIFLAAAAAAVLAYGTDPGWAQFHHGIDFILWSRRLQWPLITVTLVLCLALLTLIISGKRRAWWLIALSPILALFVHRFATGPSRQSIVLEDPVLVDAGQANFFHDEDWVVGLEFQDTAYAFPYSSLFHTPAVLISDREKRMILLWSPFANRALAFEVTRELSARDLEIVSSPANATLLYNSKFGQFINGITGQTPRGEKPAGFRDRLNVVKTTWPKWKQAHPETKVMTPLATAAPQAPNQPILPRYPMPGNPSDQRRVCFIATTQPIAIPSEALDLGLLNFSFSHTPVLLFRTTTGDVRAFDRNFQEDLSPRFSRATDPKHPQVALMDVDTNTEWSTAGIAIEGPTDTRGKVLAPVPVEDQLYWSVMKFWYPNLEWITPAALAEAEEQPSFSGPSPKPEPVKKRRARRTSK